MTLPLIPRQQATQTGHLPSISPDHALHTRTPLIHIHPAHTTTTNTTNPSSSLTRCHGGAVLMRVLWVRDRARAAVCSICVMMVTMVVLLVKE
jgi:hypothetical protein